MNNSLVYSFFLVTIASLSTMIGTFPIFITFKNQNKVISLSLFSSAIIMISISLLSLIPESISLLSNTYSYPFSTLLFFLFFIFGSICTSLTQQITEKKEKQSNKLFNIGIISMFIVILHSMPEGIVIFLSSNNAQLGLPLLVLAICFHNIPEGMMISIPVYYATKSKKKAVLFTFISALSEPLGALVAFLFLQQMMNDISMGYLLSFTSGVMVYIALVELFPNAITYSKKNKKGND